MYVGGLIYPKSPGKRPTCDVMVESVLMTFNKTKLSIKVVG